jgi:ubiquinone/menaquinone biosynthesis C-methylase UbiE
MYDCGYTHIVNIDISGEVIEQMKQRNIHRPQMSYLQMDAQKMDFPDCSFDVVLDKCTVDGIMCSDQYLLTAHHFIMEAFRVLKVGGLYLLVSYASSQYRRYMFER